ncbi:reverse transcriptase domain-containing protein [Tanacetum coccineum]
MVRPTRQNPTPEASPEPNPDIATIIAQQLQNIIPQIVTQVTANVNNANGGNGNGGNDGCSYKTFTACNPKEFDGKGGAVALTRWIEKMESVFENSGCTANQRVRYAASCFVNKALTWWNTQVQARGREAAIGMSWNDFKALLVEEFCPSNEMEKLENEFWNHTMVGANHVAYTDRCMMAIFHDMIKKTMEVVMDDFSVFGNSFGNCLSHADKMLQRCEDTNLCLNWENSHFMVKEGIVLGHKISKNRIEVDKAKVDVIAKLPHPTTVKGVRSFLGHAGFYRRFIKDFSKNFRPMTHLLEKNTPFIFSNECIQAFETLKKKLTQAPFLIAPDWDLPFELMCDASDFAIGAVLGQRHEKHFRPIHYASKTINEA